jgi:hypothetical protein
MSCNGYHCEVLAGATDADALLFACHPDHQQVTDGHQQTIVTDTGRLGWTDGTTPPEINHAHHPDELLHNDLHPPDDPDPPADQE